MSGPMIRVTRHDCQCSIKLLGHKCPHNLVRHRQGPERHDHPRALDNPGIKSIRTPDDEGEVSAALIPPLPDSIREHLAGRTFAAFVEHDQRGGTSTLQKSRGFFGATVIIPARPTLGQLDNVQPRDSEIAANAVDALAIAFDEFTLGAAF